MKMMKNLFCCIMMMALIASVIPMTPVKAAGESKETVEEASGEYVAIGDVYMRAGMGNKKDVITVIPKGGIITVTEDSGLGWYQAVYKDAKGREYQGYVSGSYFQKAGEAPKPEESTSQKKAEKYVVLNNINMREGQGTNYALVIKIPKNKTVEVTDISNAKWFGARYTDSRGVVYTGYLASKHLKKADTTVKPEPFKPTAYAATADVRMRKGQGTNTDVVTLVPKSSVVTVTDISNAGWYKVSYVNYKNKKFEGYISSAYLKKTTASAEKNSAKYTTSKAVNMMAGADKKYDVIVKVPAKATVTLKSVPKLGWYKVVYVKKGNEYVGYIDSTNLKKK